MNKYYSLKQLRLTKYSLFWTSIFYNLSKTQFILKTIILLTLLIITNFLEITLASHFSDLPIFITSGPLINHLGIGFVLNNDPSVIVFGIRFYNWSLIYFYYEYSLAGLIFLYFFVLVNPRWFIPISLLIAGILCNALIRDFNFHPILFGSNFNHGVINFFCIIAWNNIHWIWLDDFSVGDICIYLGSFWLAFTILYALIKNKRSLFFNQSFIKQHHYQIYYFI